MKFFIIVHNYAKIVHRDIKADNLLISENDELKIADFGISSFYEEDDYLHDDIGTRYYMAPEM